MSSKKIGVKLEKVDKSETDIYGTKILAILSLNVYKAKNLRERKKRREQGKTLC